MLLDSSLEGQYVDEDATKLIELASKCLQFEPRDQPNSKFLLTFVARLQKQMEEISFLFTKSVIYMMSYHLLSVLEFIF